MTRPALLPADAPAPERGAPQPPRRRRLGVGMAYLAYAGGAVGAVMALQALPAVAADAWGVPDRLVVFVATTVTSVQVGQTVGIQTLLGARLPTAASRVGAGLAAAAVAVVVVAGTGTAGLVAGGVLGGVLGLATAARTTDLLVPGARVAYQRAYCVRNLLWVAALVVVGALGWLDARSFVALTVGAWLLAELCDRPRSARRPRPHGLATGAPAASLVTIAVGFGSALLYRNDVNLVRLAVADGPRFADLHYVLLAHAFAVAAIGFATAQVLYPALRVRGGAWPGLLRGLRAGFAVALGAAAAVAVGGAVAGGAWREVGLLAAGTTLAVWTPLASAVLHHARRSLLVYLPVVACFGGLAALVGQVPAAAFCAYNLAVAAAMLAGLARVGAVRRPAVVHR